MWLLSSTYCFPDKSGVETGPKGRASKTPASNKTASKTPASNTVKGRESVVQLDVESNTHPLGSAFAGGIKYRDESDLEEEGVQQRRLERLLVYTETHTDEELRTHDVMLAKVGPTGFQFNEYVQPIRFTNQRRFEYIRVMTCIVIGYGDEKVETITMANVLEKCPNAIADNIVCVDEVRWPCMGDAGAPLVCQNMLVGTLRQEGLLPDDRCDEYSDHSLQNFTFVGYYRDWIVEHAPVRFGVWRSRSPGLLAWATSGHLAASYAAVLLLDLWMYMCSK
ncbi:uncharacterized protein LOC126278440 [Schistocerca gregaria]|uniref:uncharacterized protein LOC126278440 n=1 Tax=Schistocerca gregaria TaxID=7010 RepID=UPI00211EF9AD|nr:uncharacterized protein LOC126278440 [Schistocerca gregaria]